MNNAKQCVVDVYIALGSNQDDPLAHLMRAINELKQLSQCTLVASSSFYQTKPVGPILQDDFINAVVQLQTTLSPEHLFANLVQIERCHGRQREKRWGPRTLDLDLLLYGSHTQDDPHLQIPHPRLLERGFVLTPLAEIAPNLKLINGRTAAEQSALCSAQGILRLTRTQQLEEGTIDA